MCKKKTCRNSKKVQVDIKIRRIDECMAGIVSLINQSKVHRTLACCCGHGIYHQSIVVTDNVTGIIWEAFSGKRIDRTRNFYKMDDGGYFYIQEIDKPKKWKIKVKKRVRTAASKQ